MADAIPICLGYLAVGFSLGIAAGNADFSVAQGFWWSALNLSSSGQYAGIVLTREQASVIELILMILIANARYLLMSCALSQRLDPGMPFYHRFLMGYGITDEIFGLEIALPGYVKPVYAYGAILMAMPGWALGTCMGIFMGDVMPYVLAQALNVAIYGMFLAIIIPPGKKDRRILLFVVLGFIFSLAASCIPAIREVSSGTRILVITIILSMAAAIIFPVPSEEADMRTKDADAHKSRYKDLKDTHMGDSQ